MKVLGTKEFLEKFKSLEESDKKTLAPIFDHIGKLSKEEFYTFQQRSNVLVASKGVFVYRIKDYRLFYTLTKENEETVVLFIDIVKRSVFPPKQYVRPMASRSPRSNFNINPMSNFNINPHSNFNINPRSNFNINPRSNPYINPVGNPAFSGLIVYDLNLDTKYFIVRAPGKIILFFDFDLNWQFFGVKAQEKPEIHVIFDLNNNWVGYMVSDNASGYNYFDLTGEWVYFIQ